MQFFLKKLLGAKFACASSMSYNRDRLFHILVIYIRIIDGPSHYHGPLCAASNQSQMRMISHIASTHMADHLCATSNDGSNYLSVRMPCCSSQICMGRAVACHEPVNAFRMRSIEQRLHRIVCRRKVAPQYASSYARAVSSCKRSYVRSHQPCTRTSLFLIQ